jgi:hypothetical protein
LAHNLFGAAYCAYTKASQARQGVAARADQQHDWVLQGDDHRIYGTEGAELMHYLYPALDPNNQHTKRRNRG